MPYRVFLLTLWPNHSSDYLSSISPSWDSLLFCVVMGARPCWPPQQQGCLYWCKRGTCSCRKSSTIQLRSSCTFTGLFIPLGKTSDQTRRPVSWDVKPTVQAWQSSISPIQREEIVTTCLHLGYTWDSQMSVTEWPSPNLCTVQCTAKCEACTNKMPLCFIMTTLFSKLRGLYRIYSGMTFSVRVTF